MEIVKIEPFTVRGLSTRTDNKNEAAPETAKIGPLWQRFFQGYGPYLPPNTPLYGVYCDYESDMEGPFRVVAGVQGFPEGEEVTVAGGDYMVFLANGPMPDAMILAWQQAWAYFADEKAPKRTYHTDFELYTGGESGAVYIGIER